MSYFEVLKLGRKGALFGVMGRQRKGSSMFRSVVVGLGWCVALAGLAWAQTDTQSPSGVLPNPLVLDQEDLPVSLNASGTVSFGVRYGFGDGRGLIQRGYSQGFQINQLLALDLTGDVPVTFPIEGLFSVAAQLNSQQADNLQSLTMHFDSEHLIMDLGDFVVGKNASTLIVPDRQLKGLKAIGLWDDLTATGAFARVEGLAESKTFRGNTSSESVLFSDKQPDRPWLDQVYLRNLAGLEYYPLPQGFIDGFSSVEFNFNPDAALEELFAGYGLDYLMPMLEADGARKLDEGRFQIIRKDGETFLVLLRATVDLTRDQLRDAIDKYNLEQGLLGEARKEYPFNEDTDFELGFLERLQRLATLDVDDAKLSLQDPLRGHFFYLGRRQVEAESLKVEVLSQDQFVDINDPLMVGFNVELFAEPGIVELQFPPEFFEDKANQVRATFNYTSTSGVYILGLSIVKGSDRVFLNGALLERDLDYTIDYETGALILFRQMVKEDLLRIEYEVLRGGLGGFAEYQRNLAQLSLAFAPQPWLDVNVDVFQGADIGAGEERQRLRTMPNTHTTGGVRALADLGPLQGDLTLGYNVNAYPFDNNLRKNLPNQINAIAPLDYGGKTYVLFGHQNGLTVFDGVRWTSYDTRSGLSGRSVNGIAVSAGWVALATESGLTLVRLEGNDPFALIPNWLRFYQQDGLAGNQAFAVAFDQQRLWVGTNEGFSVVDTGKDPMTWTSHLAENIPELLQPEITELAFEGGLLYLGGAQGLQVFDPQSGDFRNDPGFLGSPVYDLVTYNGTVYAAGQRGVRLLSDGVGSGWLETALPAYAVAARDQSVWYAPASGLRVIGEGVVPRQLREKNIRALAFVHRSLWVGPVAEATERYPLELVRVSGRAVDAFSDVTTRINGRDLNRFGDIPLEDHLDLGGIGALAVSYKFNDFSVTGALEGKAKTFTAIGDSDRRDYLRWRLRGDYEVRSTVSVFAEHIASLSSAHAVDNIGFNWNEGMRFSMNYGEEFLGTRQEARANFALDYADDFLNDTLEVRVRLDDQGSRSLSRQRRTEDLTLSTSVNWQPTQLLWVELEAKSPLHLRTGRDLNGNLQLEGRVQWTPQLDFGSLQVSYDHETSNRFPRGGGAGEDTLDASMDWQSFQWNEVMLIPRTLITLGQERSSALDQVTTLALSNLVQTRWQRLSAQLRWNRDQLFSTLNQTENTQDTFVLRLDYGGWENLSPGLDWTWNRNELKHANRETKLFSTQQFGAHLGWSPDAALTLSASANLDLTDTEQERSVRYGLQSNGSYTLLETVDLNYNVLANWSRGTQQGDPFETLSFDATLGGDWRFAEDWVANLSLGLLYGTDAVDPSLNYLSAVASAQASLTF